MSYVAAVDHLHSLGQELAGAAPRRKFDLATMRVLAAALGDPQKQFPAVLIAGTNGKGSTAATLASICAAAGVRTGLYTSPHLTRVTERIRTTEPGDASRRRGGRTQVDRHCGGGICTTLLPRRPDGAAAGCDRRAAIRAQLFRIADRAGLPLLRRTQGRDRDPGSGSGRAAGCDQHRGPDAFGHHRHCARSSGVSGRHARGDCREKAGILRARGTAGDAAAASRGESSDRTRLRLHSMYVASMRRSTFPDAVLRMAATSTHRLPRCTRTTTTLRWEASDCGYTHRWPASTSNATWRWRLQRRSNYVTIIVTILQTQRLKRGLPHTAWPGRLEFLPPDAAAGCGAQSSGRMGAARGHCHATRVPAAHTDLQLPAR